MNLLALSESLYDLLQKGKIFFVKTVPEVFDFTNNSENKILIYGSGKKVEISVNKSNAHSVIGVLDVSVFESGMSILGWNFKSLLSYFSFFLKKQYIPRASVLDLKIIEHFKEINNRCPDSLVEAIARYRSLGEANWVPTYKNIYLPLLMKVIPYMETYPLVDKESRKIKYAYYEIEGQVNGRLQCSNLFNNSFNPHNMNKQKLASLKSMDSEDIFCYADFSSMEVNLLQYLSKDEKLEELLSSGEDVYKEIYQLITGDICDSLEKRNKCKLLFLPVMYGLGVKELSSEFEVSLEAAKSIIDNIKNNFSTASQWFDRSQNQAAKEGFAIDFLGRKRTFTSPYKARNFIVQSPGAIFCLEKLIELYQISSKNFRLIFSVHDGYGIICNGRYIKNCFLDVKRVLESESTIFPGLKIKAKISFGRSLDSMKVVGN